MHVLFFKRVDGIFTWLTRWWTGSRYVHAELEFYNGVRFTSLIGEGVRFLGPIAPSEEWKWDRVVVPLTIEQEDQVREFCEGEVGCAYDWPGIVYTQILGIGREDPRRWFCSEICAAALAKALPNWPSRKPSNTSPGRLHKILASLFEVIK